MRAGGCRAGGSSLPPAPLTCAQWFLKTMRQVSGSAVTGGCRLALRGARCPPARGVSLLSQLILSMGTGSWAAPGHPNQPGCGLAPPWGHRGAGGTPGSFLHAAASGQAAGRGAVRDPQTNPTSSRGSEAEGRAGGKPGGNKVRRKGRQSRGRAGRRHRAVGTGLGQHAGAVVAGGLWIPALLTPSTGL